MRSRLPLLVGAACVGPLLLMAIPSEPPLRAPMLQPVAHPVGNPPTAAKVELGRLLFHDPLLSSNQRVACSTCHDPAHGFADPRGFSIGVTGEVLDRDTPTVANLAFTTALFRDGRAASLEEQALEPLFAENEMAADPTALLAALRGNAEYTRRFAAAFGSPGISLVRIARAIAAYERTLIDAQTPYDRWAAGDQNALSPAAKRGFALFHGKADCAECHPAPLFGADDIDPIGSVERRPDGRFTASSDRGLETLTGDPRHRGAFRSMSLRGLKHTAPYMHNGVFATLAEVIDFYDRGGAAGFGLHSPNQDEHVHPLRLSPDERQDLLAFLESLSSSRPLDTIPQTVPSNLTPGGQR
ncbi:MAG TPA: cytochrome c peroxidase [Planctomycetota bacterium]